MALDESRWRFQQSETISLAYMVAHDRVGRPKNGVKRRPDAIPTQVGIEV
jgi:hypothetical protein